MKVVEMEKIRIQGMIISVGETKIRLDLLETQNGAGWANPLKRLCPQCRETKSIEKFGLRNMGKGHIRIQSYCRSCRSELSNRTRKNKLAIANNNPRALVFCPHCKGSFDIDKPIRGICPWCGKRVLRNLIGREGKNVG